uniref:Ependymin n=2 Tax=Anabas testudineus TaxID=64144 RepID=A0AAQ6IIT0_ANATE
MNMVSVLSCLTLVLAAAAAQEPRPCVVPPLMSGGFTVMAASGLVMSSGDISYDALGQRMRVRNVGLIGNQTFTLDQLLIFNQNVYYEIDWMRASCKKLPLDSTFIPMQVPPDAKLVGQAFLGSSSSWGSSLLVNTWQGALAQNGQYTVVFTEIGCIPVTFNGFTPASGWTTISTFNWVLGNTDPMEYVPPPICANAKLEESETAHTFFTALESLAMKTIEEE